MDMIEHPVWPPRIADDKASYTHLRLGGPCSCKPFSLLFCVARMKGRPTSMLELSGKLPHTKKKKKKKSMAKCLFLSRPLLHIRPPPTPQPPLPRHPPTPTPASSSPAKMLPNNILLMDDFLVFFLIFHFKMSPPCDGKRNERKNEQKEKSMIECLSISSPYPIYRHRR